MNHEPAEEITANNGLGRHRKGKKKKHGHKHKRTSGPKSTKPMMTPEEQINLSPWAKFIVFGKFPMKLLLHITLTVLITTHAVVCNAIFDDYSRSIGATWARLLFPSNYQSSEQRDWSKGYELYTVNEALEHTQYLVENYYSMPYVAVDNLEIYDPYAYVNETDVFFTVPSLEILRSGSETGSIDSVDSTIYDVYNSTDGWPLSANSQLSKSSENGNVEYMEDFFNNLISMKFELKVRTDGVASGILAQYNMCVLWLVTVQYDLGARGQLMVTLSDEPVERCDDLSVMGTLKGLCISIGLLSFFYVGLLIKATFHHYSILKKIHSAQVVSERSDSSRRRKEKREAERREREGGQGVFVSPNITPPGSRSVSPKFSKVTFVSKMFGMKGSKKTEDSSISVVGVSDSEPSTPLLPPTPPSPQSPPTSSSSPHHTNLASIQRREQKRAHAAHAESLWNALSWKDKYLYIFNLWFVVALMANSLAILYSAQFLFGDSDLALSDSSSRILLGITVALFWTSCAQYLEYFPRFYLLIWTLKVGLPRVFQFFVGIGPFFIGYALLGMTLFGDEVDTFGDFSSTCCTLFAVVNGDSILDVFDSLSAFFPIGDLYIYIYVLIFMYVVLMSVIAIVEEAFFDSLRSQGLGLGGSILPGGVQEAAQDTSGLETFVRARTASKNIDISPSANFFDDAVPKGSSQGQTSYNILGSSPATANFQSRLMPAKLREVLRNVRAAEESSSSSSESDDDVPMSMDDDKDLFGSLQDLTDGQTDEPWRKRNASGRMEDGRLTFNNNSKDHVK
ncbi:hypothetical protein TL16_g00784 [Triparma laevis f. inornata]|uniref:Polycystin cation channel PKD1/PKD2 domain-containing protein n=1 Tax=Triparma laevis f. inornata TaxID=1714386 RepID=A0A9W6ZFR2_9STRA|nr:hypothetical protein TL16_g00784 [Triparma laevis f. inornata]